MQIFVCDSFICACYVWICDTLGQIVRILCTDNSNVLKAALSSARLRQCVKRINVVNDAKGEKNTLLKCIDWTDLERQRERVCVCETRTDQFLSNLTALNLNFILCSFFLIFFRRHRRCHLHFERKLARAHHSAHEHWEKISMSVRSHICVRWFSTFFFLYLRCASHFK